MFSIRCFRDEAINLISEAGYDPVYGARPLKRFIVRQVETKLALIALFLSNILVSII
jgi:ATP-dependent Clp protease ATP-binding subunit ClpA